MKLLSILFIFLYVSCGKDIQDYFKNTEDYSGKKSKTHQDFKYYIELFENSYNVNVNVPIIYNYEDPLYAGACYTYSDGYKEIKVNKKFWENYSTEQREVLIFHELGHCVFNLDHDNNHSLYCPASVMRSYLFSDFEILYCYIPNRSYYLDDLFFKYKN